ncbi:fluoride efflux transporter CrcB [Methylovirgula sp. 4M-Z18]|uniref:fluoride efflux transporter CrcB n=1 Tax=Methylovirgula sp. 4M-Z18 TaxID=2293567 RepID=UPI000E2EAEC8|nr:fluoride efflux transporter CrcB [Methylovirgula sp. 4M-Z18]RFB80836.1 fluoride efflux transporter CrcB [Methylovirgula sp. 4M-Z18]
MQAILIVFFGGGVGSVFRHLVNVYAAKWLGTGWPWGTYTVNIVGSLVMGLLAGYFAFRAGVAWTQQGRLLLMTGILGGFTTFSAFSLDSILLWERGQIGYAVLYVTSSVFISLLALVAGLSFVRALS